MSVAVASRYARALADILTSATAGIEADAALQQLREFRALQESSIELRNVLVSPAVPPRSKHKAIGKLAERLGMATVLKNFLFVLIDHRRIAMLGEILISLQAQLDERRGIARAAIRSARPLSDEQRGEVEASLALRTGKRVVGQYAVDDSLIGGIVARVGSRVYDGSVRGQLQAMRSRLVRS